MIDHQERVRKTKEINGNDVYVKGGKIGGKAKGVKGLAYLKKHDPEAFRQHYIDMWAKRRSNK